MAEGQGLERQAGGGREEAQAMSIEEEDRLLEHAVLTMILNLHPEHLTTSELILKIAGDQEPADEESIRQAIRDLKGSGLLRCTEDIVQPTHAAVRAADLLTRQ
jgi:hypothetical protein